MNKQHVLVLASLLAGAVFVPAAAAAERPSIVFILADDVRWDDLGCTGQPFVQTPHIDRLAREGSRFRYAFATTPLCSPSRASFLTGHYAHTHGIIDNTDRSARSQQLLTWPLLLQKAGYETAFIGKWHMGLDDSARPGFDRWVSMKGQGRYVDPDLYEDGKRVTITGYVTDILNDKAVEFIRRPRAKPFVLYLAHKAVHPNLTQRADGSIADPTKAVFLPAERHRKLYADAPIVRRPNAKQPPRGKPALERRIGNLPPLSPQTGTDDETIRNRLRMLQAVEEGVGRILQALQETGQLDKTLVVFTSDHGYFYGEHGLSVERRLAYEETIRIPLLMRYPPLIKPGTTTDFYALSVDLAPTLLELAGATPPADLHGRSLLPVLKGERVEPRRSFLIEYYSDTVFPRMHRMGYQAVRTERWKYIRYRDLEGMDELYDLQTDPYEMNNLIGEQAAQRTLAELKVELDRLIRASGG